MKLVKVARGLEVSAGVKGSSSCPKVTSPPNPTITLKRVIQTGRRRAAAGHGAQADVDVAASVVKFLHFRAQRAFGQRHSVHGIGAGAGAGAASAPTLGRS